MKRRAAIICAAALLGGAALAQPSRPLSVYDYIAQARADVSGPAKDVWPGWDRTPFAIVLVDGDQEHLLCDTRRPQGFGLAAHEPLTGCVERSRARTFPPGLLASMPAFGLPAVIVVGTPARTKRSEAAWTATLMHEHFHQHQNAFRDYFARVEALNLSGGDKTGMWMLNYAFPYTQPEVAAAGARAGQALAGALGSPRPDGRRVRNYLDARAAMVGAATPEHWRYADFQLWQEGVARWTEIAAGERSSDPAVRRAAAALRASTLAELGKLDLARDKRVALYALGAGEAMLLEACRAPWQARYPEVLAMSPLLESLDGRCRTA